MFGAGPIDGPMPFAEIKSERERMETEDNDLTNGSERRALPIDNRGPYKCYAARSLHSGFQIPIMLPSGAASQAKLP